MSRRPLPVLLAAAAVAALSWFLLRGGGPGGPGPGAEGPAAGRVGAGEGPAARPSSLRLPRKGDRAPGAVDAPAPGTAALLLLAVDAATGEPVFSAVAGVHVADGGNWSAFSGEGGAIRFGSLPPGEATATVTVQGYVEAAATAILVEGRETVVTVPLHRRAALRGVVRAAADGRPLPGAEVRVVERRPVADWKDETVAARTEEDGTFSLTGGSPGVRVFLEARAEGFLPGTTDFPLPPAGADAAATEILLQAAGRLRGVVRDADGSPVEGALVTVLPAGKGAPPLFLATGSGLQVVQRREEGLLARTAEDGTFTVEGLAAGGLYRVDANRLSPAGWALEDRALVPETGEGRVDLRLAAEGTLVVRWNLPEGDDRAEVIARIRGVSGAAREFDESFRVRSGGSPLDREAGVLWNDDAQWVTEEDALGAVVLPPGRTREVEEGKPCSVDVPPGGFLVSARTSGATGEAKAVVAPGATVEVTVPLAPLRIGTSTIEGTVVDDRGEPMPNVRVTATRSADVEAALRSGSGGRGLPWMPDMNAASMATSGEGGRFSLDRLEPGETYRVRAGGGSDPVDAVAPATGLRLVHLRSATLRGRAVLPGGTTAAGLLEWNLEAPSADGGWRTLPSGREGWKDGTFDVQWAPPGPFRLWLRRDGVVGGPVEGTLAPGEARDLGDIPLRAGTPLAGRVLGPDRRPLAGVTVSLGGSLAGWVRLETHDGVQSTVTAADGSFSLGVRPPVPFTLTVSGAACVPTAATLDPAAPAPLQVIVPRGGLLRGRVRAADGLPAAGATVLAAPAEGGEPRPLPADHRGRFEARVPAGVYQVVIRCAGADSPAGTARVEEGGAADLDLRVP